MSFTQTFLFFCWKLTKMLDSLYTKFYIISINSFYKICNTNDRWPFRSKIRLTTETFGLRNTEGFLLFCITSEAFFVISLFYLHKINTKLKYTETVNKGYILELNFPSFNWYTHFHRNIRVVVPRMFSFLYKKSTMYFYIMLLTNNVSTICTQLPTHYSQTLVWFDTYVSIFQSISAFYFSFLQCYFH